MFSLRSAEPERSPRLGVVTREDLRRWALPASKTTYLGTSAWTTGVAAKMEDLKSVLVLGIAGARVAVVLQAVSLVLHVSLIIMRDLLHLHDFSLLARG